MRHTSLPNSWMTGNNPKGEAWHGARSRERVSEDGFDQGPGTIDRQARVSPPPRRRAGPAPGGSGPHHRLPVTMAVGAGVQVLDHRRQAIADASSPTSTRSPISSPRGSTRRPRRRRERAAPRPGAARPLARRARHRGRPADPDQRSRRHHRRGRAGAPASADRCSTCSARRSRSPPSTANAGVMEIAARRRHRGVRDGAHARGAARPDRGVPAARATRSRRGAPTPRSPSRCPPPPASSC